MDFNLAVSTYACSYRVHVNVLVCVCVCVCVQYMYLHVHCMFQVSSLLGPKTAEDEVPKTGKVIDCTV